MSEYIPGYDHWLSFIDYILNKCPKNILRICARNKAIGNLHVLGLKLIVQLYVKNKKTKSLRSPLIINRIHFRFWFFKKNEYYGLKNSVTESLIQGTYSRLILGTVTTIINIKKVTTTRNILHLFIFYGLNS